MIRRLTLLSLAVACLGTTVEARTWPKLATRAECAAACTPATNPFASVCTPLPRGKAERCQRSGARSLLRFCRAFGVAVCTGGAPPTANACQDVQGALAVCTDRVRSLDATYAVLVAQYNALATLCGQPVIPVTTTTTTLRPTVPTTSPTQVPGVGSPCNRDVDCQSTQLECRGKLHNKRCQLRPQP